MLTYAGVCWRMLTYAGGGGVLRRSTGGGGGVTNSHSHAGGSASGASEDEARGRHAGTKVLALLVQKYLLCWYTRTILTLGAAAAALPAQNGVKNAVNGVKQRGSSGGDESKQVNYSRYTAKLS
jgi:hypothetical protein